MQLPGSLKALLDLLADGRFHSGPDLAQRLGTDRAGVWKRISALRCHGLDIHAVPGTGYRLSSPLELLDRKLIERALLAEIREKLVIEFHDQLDSTNTHLLRRAAEGVPSGTVCLAETQSRGRGRLGRGWVSPFSGNVYLSLLWRFGRAGFSGLSLAVGVATVRALRAQEVVGVTLKWPNDLLWDGKKLGGVLIEVSGQEAGQYAVVIGIGLNLNFPDREAESIDQEWVDLARVTGGRAIGRNRLIAEMLNQLVPILMTYESSGFAPYLDEWRRFHAFDGARVRIQQGDRVQQGWVAGVTDQGLLLLDCEDGLRREFASGDVRLRPL
jgi:BirA family biotin operon repressor/biotin-[acetyl-CoA-carboxylase] ligase